MRIIQGADGRWHLYDAAGQVVSEWDDRPTALTAAGATLAPSADGVPFTMPLIVSEGVWSSDGRMFEAGTMTARPCPLPVMMQIVTDDSHDGAFLFGRLDSLTRDASGAWSGTGVTYNSPEAAEGMRIISGGFITGVSVDAAASIFEDQSEIVESGDSFSVASRTVFKDGQICGATIVATPAFTGAHIVLGEQPAAIAPVMPLAASSSLTRAIHRAAAKPRPLTAGGSLTVVAEPPSGWFVDPTFTDDTTVPLPGHQGRRGCPLTIRDTGQVFGHIALWDVPHTAFGGQQIFAPRSETDYAYFQTGAVLCADGKQVATGPLTVSTGHAELNLGAIDARAHYDNTGTVAADVACGEDQYGIWVAGYIRPGATREQVAALRASGISGDWRPIGTGLELVAALAVNSPGFPVARSRVASGHVEALVAAGGVDMLLRAAREPWKAELDDLREQISAFARFMPMLRPMYASFAVDRVKAAALGAKNRV